MSTKEKEKEEDESAILLDDFNGDKNKKQSIHINADDEEMLLLSSSPSPPPSPMANIHKGISTFNAGPSGMKKMQSPAVDHNSSTNNIVIDDSSDSAEEESLDNSIEVIGSEDEEEDEFDEESESDESLSAYLDGKVQIFMAQGSFFIWNAEDVHMLREECRIVGKLVGCLPRAPRQNSQLGLPLQLMPEEAKLLEEIEAACVVEEVDTVSDDIGALRKSTFKALREENFKAQQKMYKESRKEEVWQHKHMIIEGKRAKKRKIQESESFKEKSVLSEEVKTTESDIKIRNSLSHVEGNCKKNEANIGNVSHSEASVEKVCSDDDQDKNAVESETSKSETNVEMKTECRYTNDKEGVSEKDKSAGKKISEVDVGKTKIEDSENPQNDEVKDDCIIVMAGDDVNDDRDDEDFNVDELVTAETHVKHSLIQLFTENPWKESVKRPKHWIFPLSQKQYLRYEVFRDLWKKGYFLTSGSKFGGDFLVYPGDPARFHSHFIAVCIDKTVDLSALDIVSLGRLGSNVRKTVLLCAFNKTRQIVYTSLQWTGIS